jgi:hypothetical protein
LARIHRTTFARQAANLWAIKEALWRNLLSQIRFDPALSLVDSFPLPVCRFARVCRCRCLAGESAFSYDEAAKLTFYSLRAHVCVCWPEVICSVSLAPADVHGLRMAEGFTRSSEGVGFGRQELPEPES